MGSKNRKFGQRVILINQSIDRLIYRSINQSINQSTNQSINQRDHFTMWLKTDRSQFSFTHIVYRWKTINPNKKDKINQNNLEIKCHCLVLLTLWHCLWPFNLKTISLLVQGHTVHQVWTLMGSFDFELCCGQTGKQTDRQTNKRTDCLEHPTHSDYVGRVYNICISIQICIISLCLRMLNVETVYTIDFCL